MALVADYFLRLRHVSTIWLIHFELLVCIIECPECVVHSLLPFVCEVHYFGMYLYRQ